VVEFCLGLYRAQSGTYKLGRSRLGSKIQKFFEALHKSGIWTESMITAYGIGAWLRQERAFGDMPGDNEGFTIFKEHLLRH
jgi:hypothetical protein